MVSRADGPPTAVVTGAAGMLGGCVARHLREHGWQVHGVDLRPGDHGGDHTVADVRDRAALARAVRGADAVVHCAAALPSYPEAEIRSVIVEGTRTVLDTARDAGVDRIVHISSTAVYGLPTEVPTTEEHPRTPVDAYGRAKAAAEEVCEQYRAAGCCVAVIRPKTFLGSGRLGLFAMLFEWAHEGRHFPVLGRGDVRIQMCAVEDLVACVRIVLTADPAVASDTYNVAADRFGTLREDFQAVLDAAGHGRRVVPIPAAPAVWVLRALQRAKLSPVYERLVHKLLADSYVSIEHARDRLGFRPQYSNQDALLRTFEWWQRSRQEASAAAGAAARTGRTSGDAWQQGALRWAKVLF